MDVLNVPVTAEVLRRWQTWLAPDVQPFFVERVDSWSNRAAERSFTPELRDTYKTWKVDGGLEVLWLTEDDFFAMPRKNRASLVRAQTRAGRGAVPAVRQWRDVLDDATLRSQADGHRFVWWPSL